MKSRWHVRNHDPQIAGFGVPGSRHALGNTTILAFAAQPCLHRRDTGQEELVVLIGQTRGIGDGLVKNNRTGQPVSGLLERLIASDENRQPDCDHLS